MTARRDDGLVLLLVLIGLLLLMLCVARTAHAQVTIADQIVARQKVVAGTTTASSSPLTIVGLPGSGDILRVGAGGSVGTGPLVAADIPSVFTRRDVNEPIAGLWSFTGGSVTFGNATSNFLLWPTAGTTTPTLATRSVGTRLVLFPQVSATQYDYALGVAGGTLWASLPGASAHRFAWFASDEDTTAEPADQDLVAELTGGRDFLPGMQYSGRLGTLTRKWLTLAAAELQVETLVAQNTIATIGGRVLVGTTTVLTADMPAASTTLYTKHNNLAINQTVYLEAGGQYEGMVIASTPVPQPDGTFAYGVFRNMDGSGANAWLAGDAVFNTGTTGTGWIDLYALTSMRPGGAEFGPTIVGNVRTANTATGTGANYTAWAPRWAVGNLQGLYGYTGATYGSAFGDPNSTFVAVDATNGFRVMSGGLAIGQWDTAGVVTIGPATSSTTGKMVIDSDSVDISYRGSTLFSIYSSGSSLAQFNTPLWTTAGLFTPTIWWGSGDLAISTSLNLSNIILTPGPGPAGGRVLPGNDAVTPLGSATKRWNNLHVQLPVQTPYTAPGSGFPYIVTGDAADVTRLGYACGITFTLTFSSPICTGGPLTVDYHCGVAVAAHC